MGYMIEPRDEFEEPTIENLNVEWLEATTPEMIKAFRRLRRDDLLWIYSAQVQMINNGKCVPNVFCEQCPVMKLEDQLAGWGGSLICSLVRAILAVEKNFYRISIAQEAYYCALCGSVIPVGEYHIPVLQFGYETLRICPRCLREEEEE